MNDDLDARLRTAMRPVDADPGFADRVMARLDSLQATAPGPRHSWRRPFRLTALRYAGAAAIVLIALATGITVHERRERAAGLAARRQVIEALRVTHEKLNLAYRMIKRQSQSLDDGSPGV